MITHSDTLGEEYKNHIVFEQLTKYSEFYNSLSFSIMSFVTSGTHSLINIDTYTYSSIHNTLNSINDILLKGKINDSYSLLRLYYDSSIINIYSNLYLKDHFSLDNFTVEKIDNWVKGKEQLPTYRVMSNYIRKSDKLSPINELLYQDDCYKTLRNRCNDHTHYNYYCNFLLNDSKLYLKNRVKTLDLFSKDLKNIFILHLSYIFYLNNHYLMSSDYMDSLDCGVEPEEGSQYFVAPFIQEIFDTVIKPSRKDLFVEIKKNTEMKLE